MKMKQKLEFTPNSQNKLIQFENKYPNENKINITKNKTYNRKIINTDNINIKNNIIETSFSSSINDSKLSGTSLIESKNDNYIPINYTSQCFFIKNDKNNFTKKRNEKIQKNTMKMKGDFNTFLENNNISNDQNPRIQITNAEVPIETIIKKDIEENYDNINNYTNEDEAKIRISEKIIEEGDNDVYSKITPKKHNKNGSYNFNYNKNLKKKNNRKNYSISFPIKENDFKFDFYNNIIGERTKFDSSKFELIQDYKIKVNSNLNSPCIKNVNSNEHFSSKDIKVQFRLAEINTTQFYRNAIEKYKSEKNNGNNDKIKNPFNASLKKKFNKSSGFSERKNYYYLSKIHSNFEKMNKDDL